MTDVPVLIRGSRTDRQIQESTKSQSIARDRSVDLILALAKKSDPSELTLDGSIRPCRNRGTLGPRSHQHLKLCRICRRFGPEAVTSEEVALVPRSARQILPMGRCG